MRLDDEDSPTDHKLLSPQDAAKWLGVSVKTLRALVDDQAIPRVFVGRGTVRKRYAFMMADIKSFIQQRRQWGAGPVLRKPTTTRASSRPVRNQDYDFERLRAERERNNKGR